MSLCNHTIYIRINNNDSRGGMLYQREEKYVLHVHDDLAVTLTAFPELLFSSKAICMNFLICKSSRGENISPLRCFSSLLTQKNSVHGL